MFLAPRRAELAFQEGRCPALPFYYHEHHEPLSVILTPLMLDIFLHVYQDWYTLNCLSPIWMKNDRNTMPGKQSVNTWSLLTDRYLLINDYVTY